MPNYVGSNRKKLNQPSAPRCKIYFVVLFVVLLLQPGDFKPRPFGYELV